LPPWTGPKFNSRNPLARRRGAARAASRSTLAPETRATIGRDAPRAARGPTPSVWIPYGVTAKSPGRLAVWPDLDEGDIEPGCGTGVTPTMRRISRLESLCPRRTIRPSRCTGAGVPGAALSCPCRRRRGQCKSVRVVISDHPGPWPPLSAVGARGARHLESAERGRRSQLGIDERLRRLDLVVDGN
jgi:hypothetical protein